MAGTRGRDGPPRVPPARNANVGPNCASSLPATSAMAARPLTTPSGSYMMGSATKRSFGPESLFKSVRTPKSASARSFLRVRALRSPSGRRRRVTPGYVNGRKARRWRRVGRRQRGHAGVGERARASVRADAEIFDRPASPLWDRRSTTVRKRFRSGDRRSLTIGQRFRSEVGRSSTIRDRASVLERRSLTIGQRFRFGDRRSSTIGQRCRFGDRRSLTIGQRCRMADRRSTTIEQASALADRKEERSRSVGACRSQKRDFGKRRRSAKREISEFDTASSFFSFAKQLRTATGRLLCMSGGRDDRPRERKR